VQAATPPDLAAPSRMMYDTHDKGVTNVESERAGQPEVQTCESFAVQ